ncbi:MAG: enoyl-CoA hydratase-related protein, partial [Actinomycetota bacterium]
CDLIVASRGAEFWLPEVNLGIVPDAGGMLRLVRRLPRAPAKEAARDEVIRLRRAGHSITEITEALRGTSTPLNRTGVWELLRDDLHVREQAAVVGGEQRVARGAGRTPRLWR